jgi:hypothetical protein
VISQGDDGDFLFVVESGKLEVVKKISGDSENPEGTTKILKVNIFASFFFFFIIRLVSLVMFLESLLYYIIQSVLHQ